MKRMGNVGLVVLTAILTVMAMQCTHPDQALLGVPGAALTNPAYELRI